MLVISVLLYAGVLFGADGIAALFNSENNERLQSIAAEGLRLYFVACPFAGFNVILSMYFTSIDLPRPAHILSILRGFVVILPMAFVLSYLGQIRGVWCAFPATELLVAILGLLFFAYIRKKQREGAV